MIWLLRNDNEATVLLLFFILFVFYSLWKLAAATMFNTIVMLQCS